MALMDDARTLPIIIEVQRLIECNGYRPVAVSALSSQLSARSSSFIQERSTTLLDVLELHPEIAVCWVHEGSVLVSLAGFPWIGAFSKPHELNTPGMPEAKPDPLLRGKALTIMARIAEMPSLQNTLREISECLIKAPNRTCLVSELGSSLSPDTRALLRKLKLRATQLLRCFPEDFHVEEAAAASTVTYKWTWCKAQYIPEQTHHQVSMERYARLLKLCDDMPMASHVHGCTPSQGISPSDLQDELAIGQCLLIDCRHEEEYRIGCLQGAVMETDATSGQLDGCRVVVAYCVFGGRSASWCQKFAEESSSHDNTKTSANALKCFYLVGGVAAWAHDGGAFVQPATGATTQQVHCGTPALADFFPSTGYELLCPFHDGLHLQSSFHQQGCALRHVSLVRLQRLIDLSWEIRLHYFSSVLCLEANDVMQASCENADNFILVDCRTKAEWQISTLDVKLPMLTYDQLIKDFFELSRKPCTLIMFCTLGGRSGKVAQQMLNQLSNGELASEGPFPKVRNMLGGICAWLHAGGALVDIAGVPSRQVHTWVKPFMELFPVGSHRLLCPDGEAAAQDATPFLDCCNTVKADEDPASKIMRSWSSLAPETLADSLDRAAETAYYED